jgi:hypothetical protein
MWSTNNIYPIPNLYNITLEELLKTIPRYWGIWVHTVLKMCLQINPNYRATAKEINRFLSNRSIIKK